jgi:hypothetical protein
MDGIFNFNPKAIEKARAKGMGFKDPSELKAAESTVKESNLGVEKALAEEASKKALEKNLSKGAAVANIAQSAGVLPTEGAGGGLVSGAAAGAQFGVPGALIGGAVGGIMGAAGSAAKRKAHNRMVEAQKHQAIAQIEQQKGMQLSAAIASMGQRMSLR